jgi:hypothetical protein
VVEQADAWLADIHNSNCTPPDQRTRNLAAVARSRKGSRMPGHDRGVADDRSSVAPSEASVGRSLEDRVLAMLELVRLYIYIYIYIYILCYYCDYFVGSIRTLKLSKGILFFRTFYFLYHK